MDQSVDHSVDLVYRGVHGPGISVFGSPVHVVVVMVILHNLCLLMTRKLRQTVYFH